MFCCSPRVRIVRVRYALDAVKKQIKIKEGLVLNARATEANPR